ncbi:hypothetical protein [Neobacillus niacini]|nr:hypothetical protein [Neobacillus niacini]MDR7001098.1 hypothetical protein [Neobacillus niacini]
MFEDFFGNFRNLWAEKPADEIDIEEFYRLESKHTRIRHDEDLREIIRVH